MSTLLALLEAVGRWFTKRPRLHIVYKTIMTVLVTMGQYIYYAENSGYGWFSYLLVVWQILFWPEDAGWLLLTIFIVIDTYAALFMIFEILKWRERRRNRRRKK